MRKFKKILVFIFLLSSSGTLANPNTDYNTPDFVFKVAEKTEKVPDSVLIQYFKESVSINYGKVLIKAEKLGDQFRIALPKIEHITRLVFYFYYGKTAVGSEIYYCEPNDKINVLFAQAGDKIALEFNGFGSEKYELRNQLAKNTIQFNLDYSILHKSDSTLMKLGAGTASPMEIYNYLDKMYNLITKNEGEGKAIVSKFTSSISSDILQFYTYEFVAAILRNNLANCYYVAKSVDDKRLIANYYFMNVKDEFDTHFDNPLVKYSATYILTRGMNLLREAFMKSEGNGFPFEDRYTALNTIKDVDLRNRLVTEFFIYPKLQGHIINFSKRDSCLADAITRIKEPILQSALRDNLVFNKGSKVYDFAFKDINGTTHTLADFKGKVFMIEFYGTGCSGCANFAKQFKAEVYPEFANSPNFEVISVNLDLSKERWIKCLESGLYTQKSYVNLSAGNESINNPMFKYYNVSAIPFILLVDKGGKLISRLNNGIPSIKISSLIRAELDLISSK